MLEYEEKRQFTRSQTNCRIRYRLAGSDAYSEGICLNISGSGILFRGNAPLEVGKAAELHLASENKITPPLAAYIEVVRCEQDEGGDYRIAGAIKGIRSD
jgi:hypothetical protein